MLVLVVMSMTFPSFVQILSLSSLLFTSCAPVDMACWSFCFGVFLSKLGQKATFFASLPIFLAGFTTFVHF